MLMLPQADCALLRRDELGNTWSGGCVEALCQIQVKRQACNKILYQYIYIYIYIYIYLFSIFLTYP
jgi:hypothetical protein